MTSALTWFITWEVKKMMFNLAHASQECQKTIFWKPIPYSSCTPFCLLEGLPGPLFCLLIALLYLPVFVFSSVSLTKWWVPLGSHPFLLISLSCIFCDAWFIGAQQMLFSMNGGKNKLISARSLKHLLPKRKGESSPEVKHYLGPQQSQV